MIGTIGRPPVRARDCSDWCDMVRVGDWRICLLRPTHVSSGYGYVLAGGLCRLEAALTAVNRAYHDGHECEMRCVGAEEVVTEDGRWMMGTRVTFMIRS